MVLTKDMARSKDTKTFWIRKIRKPLESKRYENLLDPRSKDTKLFWRERETNRMKTDRKQKEKKRVTKQATRTRWLAMDMNDGRWPAAAAAWISISASA